MTEYNTGVIFRLLTEAFDSADLWRHCRDTESLRPICGRVTRNASINDVADAVVNHCMQQGVFDTLLQIVSEVRPRQFKRFEPYLGLSTDQIWFVRTDRENPRLKDLLIELAEWKQMHNDSQAMVNALSIPVDFLTVCRLRPDHASLDYAGSKWQELCVPRLKGVPDRWHLRYAYSPIFDVLREQVSEVDNITRRLMQISPTGDEFDGLYLQLEGLRGIFWEVLTIADKQIMALVETMQRIVEV